jgi:hypothetical protein
MVIMPKKKAVHAAAVKRRRRAPRGKARGGASPLKRPAAILRPAPDDPPFLKFLKRANGTLPEKIKEADLRTLNSGLGFFFSRLRKARAQFDKEGDGGRSGVLNALAACWTFIVLFRTPLDETLHFPILRLQDALDQNRIEPFLKRVRRSGRGPSSHAYDAVRGHAAATVQLLLKAGLARGDAHRAVARQLSELGLRPERGSGTVTATTVRNWCDKVSRDVGRHGTAAMIYDDKLSPEELKRFSAVSKDRARQFALQLLAAYVRSTFPDRQKPT